MDRLDFSKSIDIDPVTQVTKFFEEIMTMFNLLKEYEYVSIHGLPNTNKDNNNDISFVVEFASQEIAKIVWEKIGYKVIVVYDTSYTIIGSCDKNKLNLSAVKTNLTIPL